MEDLIFPRTFTPLLLLMFGSGLCWMVTYALVIRRGFKDQVPGMPMAALCLNICWEFIFTFIYPHKPPLVFVNVTWVLLDVPIVIQFLRYGRKDFPSLPETAILPLFLLALGLSATGIVVLTDQFNDYGMHAAFAQNSLMSILFVGMLLRRDSVEGQSIYIALSKWMGTILPAIYFLVRVMRTPLFIYLCVLPPLFDGLYTFLLYRKHRQLGLNPWKRA